MRARHVIALAIATSLLAVACGSGSAAPATTATTLTVTLTDTTVQLSAATIPPGKVTLRVVNTGTVVHSIVLLKTDIAQDKIPADTKDPSKVQEVGSVAATGQMAVGVTKELVRDLAAGNYVFICNEPAHYLVGMHVGLVVK
jgi:uncharacterized cupredoxin-like copper-binding protein